MRLKLDVELQLKPVYRSLLWAPFPYFAMLILILSLNCGLSLERERRLSPVAHRFSL
ncbi:hypothetical protein DESC_370011 [Desulfosarcina cetonica]|nr:hypothetical protein DESC_370011 [Desulfosarcina cetonica]